ncbi:unnamed protein product [Lepeophtheirus salmonis]|uniref:(salmon louse) hypothetical protein n=1 Tax=Lepeophtheirus salmonis TaxID=72036 RepID=A0A7R8HCC9_LEPSM|nr:unnamed protein product [Lepeophtheirus salmonis]CAF3004744.1 unnamed protein product [Lepeophtheirus salmonis]
MIGRNKFDQILIFETLKIMIFLQIKKTHPEDDEDSDGGTFGIQKTEKLKCFVKPKPPTNRRRPTSSVVSSRLALSSGSYAEEEHSKSSQSLEEKNTLQEISEEEGEDKNDPSEKEILTIPLLLTTDKETHNIDSEKRYGTRRGGDEGESGILSLKCTIFGSK